MNENYVGAMVNFFKSYHGQDVPIKNFKEYLLAEKFQEDFLKKEFESHLVYILYGLYKFQIRRQLGDQYFGELSTDDTKMRLDIKIETYVSRSFDDLSEVDNIIGLENPTFSYNFLGNKGQLSLINFGGIHEDFKPIQPYH